MNRGTKNRLSNLWHIVRWPLLVIISLVVLLSAALAFVVYTGPGNDFLASQLDNYVSSKIPGTLRTENLEHVEGLRFRAGNVQFFPPKRKQPVLDLNGVNITLSSASIDKGWLIVPQASVRSGVVRLQTGSSGRTTLEETFDAKSEDDRSGNGSDSKSLGVRFKNIEVSDTKFLVHMDKFKFRARDLSGNVSLRRDPKEPGIVLTLKEINGQHTYPDVIGNKFALRNLSGTVKGSVSKVVDISGSAHSKNNDMPFRVRYWKDPKRRVVANINREETSVAFDLASTIGDIFVLPDFVHLEFHDGDGDS